MWVLGTVKSYLYSSLGTLGIYDAKSETTKDIAQNIVSLDTTETNNSSICIFTQSTLEIYTVQCKRFALRFAFAEHLLKVSNTVPAARISLSVQLAADALLFARQVAY